MSSDGLDDFLRRGYAHVVAAIAATTGSRSLAEESVQEALAQALAKRVPVADWRAWTYVAARNHSRSVQRRARAESTALLRLRRRRPQPHPTEDHSPATEQIHHLLANLSAREREAVTLHYLLDLDVRTTASHLGVTPGTVKTLLSRSREKLRTQAKDGSWT